MINNYILESLKINNPKNIIEFENILREISQKIILYALSQTSFFKNAAFYGGTCLRIFHGLDRFSEDLDFQVISDDVKLDFDQYISKCINVLESYGLKSMAYSKPEYDVGEVVICKVVDPKEIKVGQDIVYRGKISGIYNKFILTVDENDN